MDVYAVIKTGGKQYRVAPGDIVKVEKLALAPGDTVEIKDVFLLVNQQGVTTGTPAIPNARVTAEVVKEGRDEKIVVFKMRRRKGYRKTIGHRQHFTLLRINEIALGAEVYRPTESSPTSTVRRKGGAAKAPASPAASASETPVKIAPAESAETPRAPESIAVTSQPDNVASANPRAIVPPTPVQPEFRTPPAVAAMPTVSSEQRLDSQTPEAPKTFSDTAVTRTLENVELKTSVQTDARDISPRAVAAAAPNAGSEQRLDAQILSASKSPSGTAVPVPIDSPAATRTLPHVEPKVSPKSVQAQVTSDAIEALTRNGRFLPYRLATSLVVLLSAGIGFLITRSGGPTPEEATQLARSATAPQQIAKPKPAVRDVAIKDPAEVSAPSVPAQPPD